MRIPPIFKRSARRSHKSRKNPFLIAKYNLSHYEESTIAYTRYQYNLLDSLTSVTDAAGNVTQIGYDLLQRKVSMDDPDMGVWTYQYDGSGNLIRQIDDKGQRLCFYYNDASQMTGKYDTPGSGNCPGTPSGTRLADYSYYASGPGKGLLAGVEGGSGAGTYEDIFTYDYRQRVVEHERIIDDQSYELKTTNYDTLDRPLTMIYPDGETVHMAYDGQFATSLTAGGSQLVENLDYNEMGQLTRLDRGNGKDTVYNYYNEDKLFRPEEIVHGSTTDSLLDFYYDYDLLGNVISIEEQTTSSSSNWQEQTFAYDDLNRLISAEAAAGAIPGYEHTYSYDPFGNITSITRDSATTNYQYSGYGY